MSEAENHPPASSVTALRIPIIKKGEYDLWCMKMRQYIAITDHILWDIITNGDQATTEPASSSGQPSAPKTSIVVNARRNNEKALNILLSAIPDRHLLSFHDAQDAQSLWAAIKARFGGNKESKKMQKNLLKQQFETFVVGAREELDSAYDRFQNIISMLELYDAKVSCEDANLKFLRSLPSVWHVVATMIRGQPGLDELDFDDLYNNLKVYEHELKGASSSNSQSIAFMSAEIKGSTSRQSTADDKSKIITKGYAQASSSKLKETLNSSFNSDEIICSFFAQQASMPETHDDEDLLQIDDDAMEEIDIRWQVAMITARIRKFMRKTGRPIDLKPKNGITFDKSKIECFNCQKLGHFARECKFAKYQANRANGSKEKRIVPIEDSNSKALVAKDSQGEIDWTKEFDDDPVTFAMVALNGIEEDDWSIEIDADHVDLGQDGLGVFDWSEEADNAPVALALMATSSTDSSNSEGLKPHFWNNTRRVHSNFSGNSRYPHQKRSFIPSAVLIREDLKSTVRSKMSQAVPSQSTTSAFYQNTARPKVSKAILSQSTARLYFQRPVFSTRTGRPYYPRMDNVRPRASSSSPPTGFFNTRTVDRPKSPKPIIKSKWVKKESTAGTQAVLPQTKGEKGSVVTSPTQTWRPKGAYLDHRHKNNGSYTLKKFEYGNPEEELKDHAIIDSGCSGSMTGDKDKLSDFKDYKGGYVAFGNDPKGGRITGKGTIKTSCIDFENVSYVKELKFNLLSVSQICDKKHNVLFTDTECLILSPEFKIVDENLVLLRAPRKNDVYSLNLKSIIPSGGVTCLVAKASEDEAILWHRRLGHVNFKNINKLVKSNLVRGLPSKTFKHDHSCLACRKGKQHKASCKKLEERTVREPLELLHMDLFGPVSVASLNIEHKKYSFSGNLMISVDSWVFFLGLTKNEDILHTSDLIVLRKQTKTKSEDHQDVAKDRMKQKGKGPDWMFDLDILSPSLNYIPVRKENQVDTAVKQSNSVDFDDVDDQQFIVHGSSPIGNKAVSAAITNDAQNKDSDESTVVKKVPLTIEDQDLQKEFENLMLQEITAHTHVENQGIASEKRKEKGKEIYDLSESDDDLPKDGIFHGNSFDDENKDTGEEIDLDLNNMDNTIDVNSFSTLKIHKNHP
ncbi:putative ribonuclease H-like domain-containing protein [Tanacetum coccineum]